MTSQAKNSLPRNAQGYAGQQFLALDAEMDLAKALAQRTGRDLFAGTTDTAECMARARICIVMNKLDAELVDNRRTFAQVFESTYGEPLRAANQHNTKGK